jgi:hypothetical protein
VLTRRLATLLVAGLVALPGCSSGSGAAAGSSPTPAMNDAQIQQIINELVQCMRQNGAPGMPDVRVENGKVLDLDELGVDEDTKRNAQSALEACKAVKNRLPPSVFGEGGENRPSDGPGPEDVPALRKFAQCMRDNGVPEFPDPNADGTFPRGTIIEIEGKSPRMVQGFQACQSHYDGKLLIAP